MKKYLGWIVLIGLAFVAGFYLGAKYLIRSRNQRECGFHQIEKDHQLQAA